MDENKSNDRLLPVMTSTQNLVELLTTAMTNQEYFDHYIKGTYNNAEGKPMASFQEFHHYIKNKFQTTLNCVGLIEGDLVGITSILNRSMETLKGAKIQTRLDGIQHHIIKIYEAIGVKAAGSHTRLPKDTSDLRIIKMVDGFETSYLTSEHGKKTAFINEAMIMDSDRAQEIIKVLLLSPQVKITAEPWVLNED